MRFVYIMWMQTTS